MLTSYESALISLVIAGIIVLVTGLLLRSKKYPYPIIWYNLHKFISIAASILLGFIVYRFADFDVIKFGGRLLLLLIVLLIILEFISGGLLNTKRDKKNLKFMHAFTSLLIIIFSVIVLIYMF